MKHKKRKYYKTEFRANQVLTILKLKNPKLAEKLSVRFDREKGYYLSKLYHGPTEIRQLTQVELRLENE